MPSINVAVAIRGVLRYSETITMLADLLGAPRETTSRLCKKLMDHGLIKILGKRIYITDPEKMVHFYKTGTY